MLAEAVRTSIFITDCSLELRNSVIFSLFYVIGLSEDGMYLLINSIGCAHPPLFRYHPIVADHTREDLRPLARSCLQRRLEGTKTDIGVD